MYEGGIRVPFIVKYSERISAGSTSYHLSAFWNFLTTVCELVGVTPTNKDINGVSLVPELLGNKKAQQKHDYLYWEFNEKQGPIQAILQNDWKLVWKLEGSPEFYNLSKDIGETKNLALTKMFRLLKIARTEHSEFPLTTRKVALQKRG